MKYDPPAGTTPLVAIADMEIPVRNVCVGGRMGERDGRRRDEGGKDGWSEGRIEGGREG